MLGGGGDAEAPVLVLWQFSSIMCTENDFIRRACGKSGAWELRLREGASGRAGGEGKG